MTPALADDPIFIVGTERSGSNLLRLILHAHPHIAVPHPPHLLRYFTPLEAGYGDLGDPRRFTRLVDDVLGLLRVHIHPWEVAIDRERLLAEAQPRDLYGVFRGLYDQYRDALGRARWGCKSTFVIHAVERVLEHQPGARFVWLVRDPRDVAASSRRSVFSPFHPARTARLWRDQQALALRWAEQLGDGRWLRMRYEDLLADADGEVRRLCAFLGEPFAPELLAFHRGAAARTASRLSADWANTARPVMRANSGKYRAALTHDEIRQVESICAPAMRTLAYPLDTDARPISGASPWTAVRERALDLRWRAQVELRSARTDANHWRRWARDGYVAWLRVRRGGGGLRGR